LIYVIGYYRLTDAMQVRAYEPTYFLRFPYKASAFTTEFMLT